MGARYHSDNEPILRTGQPSLAQRWNEAGPHYRGFATTAYACDHDQLITGKLEVYVLQVVFPGPKNFDIFLLGWGAICLAVWSLFGRDGF